MADIAPLVKDGAKRVRHVRKREGRGRGGETKALQMRQWAMDLRAWLRKEGDKGSRGRLWELRGGDLTIGGETGARLVKGLRRKEKWRRKRSTSLEVWMYISCALLFGQYFDGEVKSGECNPCVSFFAFKGTFDDLRQMLDPRTSFISAHIREHIARWAVPVHLLSHTTQHLAKFRLFNCPRWSLRNTRLCTYTGSQPQCPNRQNTALKVVHFALALPN
jgi:hypothetical protein